jgi:hypothetical protein
MPTTHGTAPSGGEATSVHPDSSEPSTEYGSESVFRTDLRKSQNTMAAAMTAMPIFRQMLRCLG